LYLYKNLLVHGQRLPPQLQVPLLAPPRGQGLVGSVAGGAAVAPILVHVAHRFLRPAPRAHEAIPRAFLLHGHELTLPVVLRPLAQLAAAVPRRRTAAGRSGDLAGRRAHRHPGAGRRAHRHQSLLPLLAPLRVTPRSPQITPKSPQVTANKSKVTPSHPKVTPSHFKVTPSHPKVTPSHPSHSKVTPSHPKVTQNHPN
jgi:hypothetical protein